MTASVPAWMIATALGNGVVALVSSVAIGELIYATIVMVCRRPTVVDAVRLGRRTALGFGNPMTTPAPADINVLILTYGAANKHRDLVEAVTESGVSPQQIVLIHNPDGSPDGARPWAPPDASTLIMPRNVGYGHAMNAGIRFAAERGAEWLLLLTHDVQFADSALTTLLAARECGDGFAVLGPRQRADDDSVYSFGGVHDAKTLVRHVTDKPVAPIDGIAECLWIDGCAMLVRSAPVIAAGLMRGDFFMYFDEPEICLRIRRLGWTSVS